MQSEALLEARRRGEPAFPVLRVQWMSRALDLGLGIYSPTMRETAAGGVTAVTKLGGWGSIKYGSGINDTGLKAVETSVSIADPDGDLVNMLETYDPRGSEAIIDWAAPGLALEDWEPVFSGVVMDWARDGLFTKLILKTDDTLLRSPIPPGVYQRAEWGAASEATIYGTSMPLVMGVHDSWQVTQRGMVAATNIRYDKDQGYWWLASVDRMMEITRIYFDGIPQGEGGWSVLRGVYGQSFLTIIVLASGFQPEKGVVVAFDCRAMDEDGLTLGTPLTGAPDQLRAHLEEYTFRPAPLRGWRGPLSICEPTSWDAVSEFFALHKIESAHKTGGDQEPETAAAVVDSFLQAYTWVRMWWTETGQIAIAVIDPDDVDPTNGGWLDLQKHHDGGQVPFMPGDRREVYTHIKMPFMWSSSEQKYLTAYEAHDVAALPEKLELSTDNPWSQCRFSDPTGDLNPAPPADPTPPAFPGSSSLSASPSPSLPPGEMAYWQMEETTGDRLDSVGANDLTPSGGATQVAGKVNNAVRVASASPANKLEKAITSGLATTGDYTLAGWIYIESGPSSENYITLADTTPQDLFRLGRTFVTSSSNRVMRFVHKDAGGEKTVTAADTANYFPLNTWVLFVATYDSVADTLTLETGWTGGFGDFPQNSGTLTSVGSMVSPSGDVRITFQGSDLGSNVQYDEVGLWHQVLTDQEKQGIFAGVTLGDLDIGLQHYYRMEEATGNSARVDLESNGDWTATGSPTQSTGKNNFGVGVSVGKYLSMSTPTLLPSTFTLAFWINPTSYTELFGNPTPILVSDSVSNGFDFTRGDGLGSTEVRLRMYPGAGSVAKGGNVLSTGSWHAVVIWATPTTFGFQVDGGSDSTASTSFTQAGNNMLLGYLASTSVNGVVDEMEIWDRVLSSAERAIWYNAGAGQFR